MENDYLPEARMIARGIADAGDRIGKGIENGLKAIASAMNPNWDDPKDES